MARLIRSRSHSPARSVLECQVVLLNNSEFNITFETRDAEGCLLFHEVCDKTEIPFKCRKYFGLQYIDRNDGETNWLDLSKPIRDQVPSKSKNFNLQLAVKVFPANPLKLDAVVQRLIVLQMKNLFARGKITLPIQKHALLDSYFAQAMLGDYNQRKHGLGYLEDLLGSTFFSRPSGINCNVDVSEASYAEMVTSLHKSRKGLMTADEAIMAYLDLCVSVQGYGLCIHRGAADKNGVAVILVISLKGIKVFSQDQFGEPGELLQEHHWEFIVSIMCSKAKFFLSISSPSETTSKAAVARTFRFHGHFGFQNAQRVVTDSLNHQALAFDKAIDTLEKQKDKRSKSLGDVTQPNHLTVPLSGRPRSQSPMASLRRQMRK